MKGGSAVSQLRRALHTSEELQLQEATVGS